MIVAAILRGLPEASTSPSSWRTDAGFHYGLRVEANPTRRTMPESLSRFLVEHEQCGAGFEVAHPSGLGSGRVAMTCRGCGASHEYAGASLETESPQRAEPREDRPQAAKPPSRRSMRPAILAVAAILAAALVVILVVDGSDSDEPAAPSPADSPAASTGASSGAEAEPEPPRPLEGAALIRTRVFVVKLPRGWNRETGGGRLLLRPAGGGSASLQIFFEREPDLSLERMRRQTRRFLRRRSPDARITAGRELTVRGDPGFTITAFGGERTERAVGVARGAVRYLLLRSVGDGVAAALRREVIAAEESFSPR
jgi:hypothetical protein